MHCSSLKIVDLHETAEIGVSAFDGCTNLEALILRSVTLCNVDVSALLGTKLFDSSGIPTGESFVYVPASLVDSYVADFTPKIITTCQLLGVPMDEPTATYIATAILRKIEDYPEICG